MHGSFYIPVLRHLTPARNTLSRVDSVAVSEAYICKRTNEIIQKHYPKHPWNIEVDLPQGIVKLQLSPWMGPYTWMVIHVSSIQNLFVFEQRVKDFCGQILERYNVPRSKFSLDHWRDASARIPLHRRFHGWIPN